MSNRRKAGRPGGTTRTAQRTTTARILEGESWTFTFEHEPSVWLRDMMARIADDLATGQTGGCGHPDAAILPLWAPNTALCPDCAREDAHRIADAPENWKCDRCGAVTDRCHPLIFPGPGVLLCAGMCDDCLDREGLD